ncbi:MAG: RimK/LysX family protein [Pseudomonadota bacterium]
MKLINPSILAQQSSRHPVPYEADPKGLLSKVIRLLPIFCLLSFSGDLFFTPLLAADLENLDPAGAEKPSAKMVADDARGKAITLGFLENVSVGGLGLAMKGKLDTGADTSSVYARDIELYDRKGKDTWVRFRLIGNDGRSIRYDQNVVRFTRIKTKRGGSVRRPVIYLPLCVGGKRGNAELNLADRSHFDFDILIGREFLAHRIVVDSGKTFAAEQSCDPNAREDDEIAGDLVIDPDTAKPDTAAIASEKDNDGDDV